MRRVLAPCAALLIALAGCAGPGLTAAPSIPAGASSGAAAEASSSTEATPSSSPIAPVVATPVPTDAPVATDTPTPTDTPVPTDPPAFKTITASGRGSKVLRFSIPDDAAAIATISGRGSDNFVIWSLASDGSDNELLVNVIGNYAGTVLFDEDEGEHSVAFKIDASGTSWKVTIRPIDSARTWNGASKLTGRGDDVVQLDPISSGLTALNITHSGQDNFIVKGYSDSGTDLMVNEIGKYKGQVPLADGSFLVTVQADGSWTMVAAQ